MHTMTWEDNDDAGALTAAGLAVDALIPLHSERAEWPVAVRPAAVELMNRSTECTQVALRAHVENNERGEEPNFQTELKVVIIGVAKTAAVVAGSPCDDQVTRGFVGRIFKDAIDELDHPLLTPSPLSEHSMLVDAIRIAAWSGGAFRNCCTFELETAEIEAARDRAVAMLITLGVSGLHALAASMIRAN